MKIGLKQTKIIKQPVFQFFRFLLLLMLLPALCGASLSATAENAVTKHEVVLLLDISGSMNGNDPEKLAPDCLKEFLYALPSNYAVGFVTFSDDVQMVKPLDTPHDQVDAALDQIQYSGYTNTGAGLEKALALLGGNTTDKTIVLLTDGEIGLDNPAATQASQAEFNRAMQAAHQRGVRICTVAIDWPDHMPDVNIYDAAKRQGTLYSVHNTAELSGVVKKILYEQLGVAKIAVNSGDLQTNTLHVQWPQSCNDNAAAKILLTSATPLGHVSANYASQSGGVITGKRFALVNLQHPQSATAQIQLETTNGGQVQTDLILELDAAIQADVKNLPPDQTGHRLAEVRLTPVSAANPQQLLLNDPYFAGKPVHVTADGQPITATVDNGAIRFTLAADTARTVTIKVRYEDLGVNIVAPATTSVPIANLSQPPASRAIPVRAAAIAAAVLIAAIAVAVLIWQWRKRPPKPDPAAITPPVSLYEYAGKLKIFITQAPDDSDIAPLEYNLYRCFTRAEISLEAILANCTLPFTLPGARNILLSPGADKALILTNKSDCTILKTRELLVKNHSCLVHFQERIHITFEDERSEMILEYKNVKPSERR